MWKTAWSTEAVGKMLEMSFYFQCFFHSWSKQFSTFTHGYNTFGFSQIFCVFHVTFDLVCISPQRISRGEKLKSA